MREELGWVGEEGLHGEVEGSEVGVHFFFFFFFLSFFFLLVDFLPFYGILYSWFLIDVVYVYVFVVFIEV